MRNYKLYLITAVAIIFVIILGVFIVQGSQNKAISLEENVQTAKADIDTQLQRRFNVLSELAECVKAYDQHEYDTLTATIAARGTNMSESEADDVVAQINAVAEAYPELKSQDNYKQFMTEIATTENLIAQFKQAYNTAVKDYNRYVRSFPHRQFISMTGYEVVDYEYYQTDKTDSEPITLFE